MSESTDAREREIVITRVFDAPRELVWKVWTQPEHITRWWGPRCFDTTVKQMDLRPGGRWAYVMHGPDGSDYPCCGTFIEVVPLKRIVSTDEFGEDFVAPPGMDLPQEMVVTTVFEDEGNKTKLTITITHPTVEDKKKHEAMGVVGGWNSSFDCMDNYLADLHSETQIRQLIADQMAAIRAKDVDKLMAAYAANVTAFDAIPPFQTNGADAWRKTWEGCLPYFPDAFQIETRDLHVFVSGEAAFAHWMFRFVTPDPNHPAAQSWMRLTGCYQKVRGAWKIVHEHCSVPFDPHTSKAMLTLDV
jgi:uncharacterized protein YndB with AHSA1/START domain